MKIWKKAFDLSMLNAMSKNTLIEHLAIRYTQIEDDALHAVMPVCSFTHQPLGMLHGGASVVLAETLGSVAANFCVTDDYYCVGLDINANHIRAMREGTVEGIARPIHLGVSTQVWQIQLYDEHQHLICTSRLTVAVMKHKRQREQ